MDEEENSMIEVAEVKRLISRFDTVLDIQRRKNQILGANEKYTSMIFTREEMLELRILLTFYLCQEEEQ